MQLANKLRIAVIGQSVFGQEVFRSLRKEGHSIVGVFTVPDINGKQDPLGEKFLLYLPLTNVVLQVCWWSETCMWWRCFDNPKINQC
uniref:Uncharacterized protein n=1 Tax=Eptatretus burgeri TaxID=7764 RepID=A0A8C4NE96_EPTBU